MERIGSGVRHSGRAQVAGWLLLAFGSIFIGYLIVGTIVELGRADPWSRAFLPAVLVVGLAVSVPPPLVGIAVLHHGPIARWLGILVTVVGTLGCGLWLISVAGQWGSVSMPWPVIAILTVLLAASIYLLWALATSGDFFGDRYEELTSSTASADSPPR